MSDAQAVTYVGSPIGVLRITGNAEGVASIAFLEGWDEHRAHLREIPSVPSPLAECREQLREYVRGNRLHFSSLRLLVRGTEFQCRVWDAVRGIPHGNTATYGEIAAAIGLPGAAQAVGSALHANPLAVAIPCHRVVPTDDGTRSGYAWGAWRKQWLLKHEGKPASESPGTSCTQSRSSPSRTLRECGA